MHLHDIPLRRFANGSVFRLGQRLLIVVGLCGSAAAITTAVAIEPQDRSAVPASELDAHVGTLHGILLEQSQAWNAGDIPRFMQAYWQSEELTFSSGGGTTRGWQATKERYLKRYPDRATMGKLTFADLETQFLGQSAALTLGQWRLERDQPIGGNFSLVWRKFDDGWKIIHDHTSTNDE